MFCEDFRLDGRPKVDLTQQSSTKTDSPSAVYDYRVTQLSPTQTLLTNRRRLLTSPRASKFSFYSFNCCLFFNRLVITSIMFTNSQSGNVLKNKELVCPDYPVTGSRICEHCMWTIFHYKHSVSLKEQINIHAGTACQISLKHQHAEVLSIYSTDRHQSARNGRHEETTNTTQVLDLNLEGSLKIFYLYVFRFFHL